MTTKGKLNLMVNFAGILAPLAGLFFFIATSSLMVLVSMNAVSLLVFLFTVVKTRTT